MITIRKIFNISVDNEPYSYLVDTNAACISYTEISRTTTQLTLEFTLSNQTCLANANVILTVVDSEGCSVEQVVDLADVCASLALADISITSDFQVSTIASGGTAPYTYQWNVDDSIFAFSPTSNITSSNVALELLATPTSTIISCTVTDANGCKATKSINYSFAQPLAGDVILQLNSMPAGVTQTACPTACSYRSNVELPVTGDNLDYDSISISNSDPRICIVKNGDNNYSFYSSYSGAANVSFTYTIKDIYGVESDPGTISLNIPICKNTGLYISSPTTITPAPSGATAGDVIEIALDAKTLSTNPIDWTTWQAINTPAYGTVSLNANRAIEYEFTSVPTTGADMVIWRVEDTSGNSSANVVEVVNFEIGSAPVVTGEIVCATCAQPSAITDILSNDAGDINRRSVVFTSIDPDIAISGSAGLYSFTPGYGASFSNVVKYTVDNFEGLTSSEANVVVVSVCAGQATQNPINATCIGPVIDLGDYITGHNSLTYTVVEQTTDYTLNGGTIDTTLPEFASLDFTGIPDGTYTFRVEATSSAPCVDTHYIDIDVIWATTPAAANDVCADATSITYGEYVVKNNQTLLDNCPVAAAPTDSGVALPASWSVTSSGDLWYKFTVNDPANLTPYIYMQGVTATDVQIALYSGSCGALSLEADAVSVTNQVQLDSGDYTTLVDATQYWIRVSTAAASEGTFRIIISKYPIS
jgi:hypothetical protein